MKRGRTYNLRTANHLLVDGRRTPTEPATPALASPIRRTDRRIAQMTDLGVTSAQVRDWAHAHQIPVTPRGMPSRLVIDAYARAQRAA